MSPLRGTARFTSDSNAIRLSYGSTLSRRPLVPHTRAPPSRRIISYGPWFTLSVPRTKHWMKIRRAGVALTILGLVMVNSGTSLPLLSIYTSLILTTIDPGSSTGYTPIPSLTLTRRPMHKKTYLRRRLLLLFVKFCINTFISTLFRGGISNTNTGTPRARTGRAKARLLDVASFEHGLTCQDEPWNDHHHGRGVSTVFSIPLPLDLTPILTLVDRLSPAEFFTTPFDNIRWIVSTTASFSTALVASRV